jgi:hypothetical protein
VAIPEPFSVPVPSVVAPSLKVTVPVGVGPEPVTVAVNVTDWPNAEGLAEEVMDVVEASLTMTAFANVNVALAPAEQASSLKAIK